MVLTIAKNDKIPIFKGDATVHDGFSAEISHFGEDGFGGYQRKVNAKEKICLKNLREESAADFLISSSKKYPKELTLICLGPLSNIAEAIQKDKEFASNVKNVIVVGG